MQEIQGTVGLIPETGRSPGEENGKPLQYSYQENPMDRGVWWAPVHRVSKDETWLKWFSTHEQHICSFSILSHVYQVKIADSGLTLLRVIWILCSTILVVLYFYLCSWIMHNFLSNRIVPLLWYWWFCVFCYLASS